MRRLVGQDRKIELLLSAKAEAWRMHDEDHGRADESFTSTVRPAVLRRDRNTCRFCGFSSSKWQEVHHLDDDHHNNDPANLVTADSFCHMVQHIGRAGMHGEAMLIWLPEIEQAPLNNIVRALYVAERHPGASESDEIGQAAGSLLAMLQNRARLAAERLGTSDPAVLGSVLVRHEEIYERRQSQLAGLRLLPLPRKVTSSGEDVFGRMMAFWCSSEGPFGGLPPSSWARLLSRIEKRLWPAWQDLAA